MKSFLLLLSLFTIFSIRAQSNEKKTRDSFELKMTIDERQFYQTPVKPSSIVMPRQAVQIYPTEKIFLEITWDGNVPKSIVSVRENIHPEYTLEVTFNQEVIDKKHGKMLLKITNPFGKTLICEANRFMHDARKWTTAPVDSVDAKTTGTTTWNEMITILILSNFRLQQ